MVKLPSISGQRVKEQLFLRMGNNKFDICKILSSERMTLQDLKSHPLT